MNLVDDIKKNHIDRCIFGAAGTGKSHFIRYLKNFLGNAVVTCAPTGIAAVNIESCTINSLFGFYNAESLCTNIKNGIVSKKINSLRRRYVKYILIDEAPMLSRQVLDLIYWVVNEDPKQEANPIKFILVGDPGQLPPVSGSPFFEATCLSNFKVELLTDVIRQKDSEFIECLSELRVGKPHRAYDYLESKGCFEDQIDYEFEGPSVFSTNDKVNSFNLKKLLELDEMPIIFPRVVNGTPPKEWLSLIPKEVIVKHGSLVMVTKNLDSDVVNGTIGIVKEVIKDGVILKLYNGKSAVILYTGLVNLSQDKKKSYISFLPISLAYSTTIHKCQGSTFEALQVSLKEPFIKRLSGGLYTCLSRCRDVEGLRLVGTKEDFISSCYIDAKYENYINGLYK